MNWYFFWLLEFVTWLLGVIFNALWLKRLLWCLWYKHTLCFRWKHTANIVAVCQAATWLKKASCDETVRGDFMLTLNTANKCYHLQAHDRISAWETGIYFAAVSLCALFLMAHFLRETPKLKKDFQHLKFHRVKQQSLWWNPPMQQQQKLSSNLRHK